MEKEKPLYQQLDFGLLFLLMMFGGLSLIAVYQATFDDYGLFYIKRQIVWYTVGFMIIAASLVIDYRKLRTLAYPMYGVGLTLLLIVMLFGESSKGAQRWLEVAGFKFQPSEFMKIFLVVAIAYLLIKTQEKLEKKTLQSDIKLTGKIAFLSIVPFALILQQPDLGTALVLIGIVAIMLLVAGISWRILFALTFVFILMIVGLVFLYFMNFDLFTMIIKEHQLSRIYGWLSPEAEAQGYGYQLLQALMAIGSGQLVGKRFDLETPSAHWEWIPEVHTDFIFAVIGEEFGFIGASVLISFYFILIYRLVQIALNCNEPFGSYLVCGVIGMIVFQVFQNIGMTIGLLPITGLALPFISYGGSALLTNMIAMGIVLNVSMRTKVYMFD